MYKGPLIHNLLCSEFVELILNKVKLFILPFLCQHFGNLSDFSLFSSPKIWLVLFFYIPLHSLSENIRGAIEEAFFEKIYIDREVVQEAIPLFFRLACGFPGNWVYETNRSILFEHSSTGLLFTSMMDKTF